MLIAPALLCAALTAAPALPADHIRCFDLTVVPGHVKRGIDGDTYVLFDVDVVSNEQHVRERRLDTPERGDSLYYVARDSATAWLARGSYRLDACTDDSFGRLLGTSVRGTDTLSAHMIRLGLGVRVR